LQMPLYLPNGYATGVQGQDFVVKARPACQTAVWQSQLWQWV
jgi:hypothetical protein